MTRSYLLFRKIVEMCIGLLVSQNLLLVLSVRIKYDFSTKFFRDPFTWMLLSSSSRGDCAGMTSTSELSDEVLRFLFLPTTGVMVLKMEKNKIIFNEGKKNLVHIKKM